MQESVDFQYLPQLTYIELYILVALLNEDLHGLGLIQEILETTKNEILITPGTLYPALKRLQKSGWIAAIGENESATDNRRKYYHILPKGREVIKSEVQRMETICQIITKHLKS
jgi:DNA-binding PadR family transcriptional regulator